MLIAVHPAEARAEFWDWFSDLFIDRVDDTANAALTGMMLPPDAIVTAPGEVRTIQLGRDLLELHPSTAVTVEALPGNTTIVHVITGTVRAKVAKRKNQTFRVDTPLLVATVKGTVFEVSAIGTASALSVYEGRVAVKAKRGVGGIDVMPGRTATVTGADREPSIGRTPKGGAAAAAKALAGGKTSKQARKPDDEPTDGDGGSDRNRDASSGSRASPGKGSNHGSGGSGGGSNGDGGEGGDSEGGDGEGGEGEGGEGEGGDDD